MVAGARGPVGDHEAVLRKASAWAAERASEVLLADAALVFGREHLESAALHAERAAEAGTMVARSISLESLRYLAGERQLADAIRRSGLKAGSDRAAVLLFGEASADDIIAHLGWTRDDSVLDAAGKDLAALGVPKRSRGTLPRGREADLALERVALVDVDR